EIYVECVALPVPARSALKASGKACPTGYIKRAEKTWGVGDDIGEMMQQRSRAHQKHDVMRVVLAVEEEALRLVVVFLVHEIIGEAEPDIGVEPPCPGHVRHQALHVIVTQSGCAPMELRLVMQPWLGRHAGAEFERH